LPVLSAILKSGVVACANDTTIRITAPIARPAGTGHGDGPVAATMRRLIRFHNMFCTDSTRLARIIGPLWLKNGFNERSPFHKTVSPGTDWAY
jgi:hypothetical protein